MADFREYMNRPGKVQSINSDNNSDDYGSSQEIVDEGDRLLRAHGKKRVLSIIFAVVVIGIIVITFMAVSEAVGYGNGYQIDWSNGREEGAAAKYTEYGKGYLKYSNDGIAYFGSDGKSIWNHTYTMKSPQLNMCGDKLAVADVGGTTIMVFDQKGYINSIDTAMVINQAYVTKNGLVVAVVGDSLVNYIVMFDAQGKKIYEIRANLEGNGYPLDVAVTSDGVKLMCSFLAVDKDTVKTNVVFYNFSEIGQNETERLVGGFNHYGSTIVPEVAFLTDKRAMAVGDNIISLYNMGEYPKLLTEINIDSNIEKVIYNADYIGVVTTNKEGENAYTLTVYNSNGKKKFAFAYNENYSVVKFDNNGVIMFNDNSLRIVNMSGHTLFSGALDMPIENIVTTGSRGKYYLISSKYIQKIRFN